MLKANAPKNKYINTKNIGCPNGIIEDSRGYFICTKAKSVTLVILSVMFMYPMLHERIYKRQANKPKHNLSGIKS